VSAGDEDALVSDLNDFGLRVLVRLASGDRNFVASPVSGFVALAMTSAGALGATAAEMRSVLYPDVSETEAHAAVNLLQQQIRGYARAVVQTDDGEKKVDVNLVNDLFAQKGMTIEPPFLDTLAVNYGSGVELVDFEKDADGATLLIDDWVAKETNDRIKDLIPLGALDALTRAVVVNALYLHANWKTAFNPAATHTGPFHGATGDGSVDFMHAERDFNYATGPGWVGVDIPYYGDSLVFTAVLPDAGQFEAVKTSLNAAWLSKFDQTAKSQYIYITLPKFKIARMSAIWTHALVDLGMTTLFNSACNLRGIVTEGPSIRVKDVLQQVFVDVTESGTEAAAATSVTFSIDIAPTANVVLDRPFLFFVRQRSGPILFAGQILDLPVL
jgi:serpin B